MCVCMYILVSHKAAVAPAAALPAAPAGLAVGGDGADPTAIQVRGRFQGGRPTEGQVEGQNVTTHPMLRFFSWASPKSPLEADSLKILTAIAISIVRDARRGAWGARTVRATAAVDPGAARRGALGAHTVGATAAAAVGPEGERVG